MRPWSDRLITDCKELLQPLPSELLRLLPHPYAVLGAPYGRDADPFRLRSGVVRRLLDAQTWLQQSQPGLRFAIFDAWRPIPVQAFMVDHSIAELCRERRIDPTDAEGYAQVVTDVGRFWAPPSDNPATPPPHSTGAAVDLTLATMDGEPLAMGGAIDAIGACSEPDHYAQAPTPEAQLWHQRRQWLTSSMKAAGFAQHPNEWWHFSFGDQLWAWRSGCETAIYAAVDSSSATV